MQPQISSAQLTVVFNHAGAEICSITDKKGLEYIWQAGKEIWPRHAPLLFPIVGRLKDNSFLYKGRSYELMQHGFARDQEFNQIEKNDTSCCFELRSSIRTKEHFPFDFILRVTYHLENDKLTSSYKVINPAQEFLFFSLGAHPGFNCPLVNGEHFEDYYLEFDRDEIFYTELENGLRTDVRKKLKLENKKLGLKSSLFDQDALVFEDGQIGSLSLCSGASSHKVHLECSNWPYFGVWTKKGTEQFICLEPWFGVADDTNTTGQLTQKDGILKLKPEGEFDCSFTITIG